LGILLVKEQIKASFSKSAATYDQAATMHEQIIDDLLALINGDFQKILDIGCGTGTMAAKLAEKFPKAEIVGLDLAPGMVELAKTKVANPKVTFLTGDGEALSFPNASFDLVVSTSSLQWMECCQVFKEVRRVLKPGGAFYFATFGPATMAEAKLAGLAINDLASQEELLAALLPHFQIKIFSSKIMAQEFSGIFDLGKYLKAIGAAVPISKKQSGLRKIKPKKVKASFEVFIGCGFDK